MASSISIVLVQQLLLLLPLLLVLIMTQFHPSSSNDLVTRICDHTDDPPYCNNQFNADARTPGADLFHLGEIAIDIGLVVATKVSNIIEWKKKATVHNEKLVEDFNVCLEKYDSAKDYLVSAQDARSKRDYGNMTMDAHYARLDGQSCEQVFMSGLPPLRSPITPDNKHFDEITHAIGVIASMLTISSGV